MADLKPLDDLFKGAATWRIKLIGAFGLGMLMGLAVGVKMFAEDGNGIGLVVAPPVMALILAFAVAPFLIADDVARRMNEGQHVGLVMRVLFGPSAFSRTLRCVLISIVVVVLIVGGLLLAGPLIRGQAPPAIGCL